VQLNERSSVRITITNTENWRRRPDQSYTLVSLTSSSWKRCLYFFLAVAALSSGVTSHRQARQCRGAQGPKTVNGAQSDLNYASRLLLDCVPVFHKIITAAYLLFRSGPVAIYYSEIYSIFYGSGHTVTSSLLTFCNTVDCRFELVLEVQRWTMARSECLAGGPKIIVMPLALSNENYTRTI